uniref:Uncharacterized protein n=1 Tax=Arundo donax TaxID=35708 RepID=A0A0A9GCY7_ARUDO
MVGCVGNLYASVEKLDATYVQPGAAKDALLRPTVLSPVVSTNGSLFSLPAPPSAPARPKKFFRCSDSSNNTSTFQFGCSYSNSSCRRYMPTRSSNVTSSDVGSLTCGPRKPTC